MSKFDSHFRMKEKDVISYVMENELFGKGAKLKAQEIGDGNINYVFRVWDEKTEKSLVIKQADKLLRSSGRPLDVDRNRIEAEVLKHQGELAPGLVPKVYFYDPIMCAFVMEDISQYQNLRKALLNREIFPELADHITTFIVNTLLPTTDLVMDSASKKDNVRKYINKDLCKISEDLVFTEPYIDYKGRNVILQDNIQFVTQELYNDKQLILQVGILKNKFMNNAQALIHGDLHSGSIFVTKESTKVLDPEFAFYGPIGYDLGNVIGNLFFAWANAYVQRDCDTIEFTNWISQTIEDIVKLFKDKFLILYKAKVTDVMAKQEDFMSWYLASVLSDSVGVAGLEMIRRVVGDAKVEDITSIEDTQSRIEAEWLLIKTAKSFILRRESLKNGTDLTKEFRSSI